MSIDRVRTFVKGRQPQTAAHWLLGRPTLERARGHSG